MACEASTWTPLSFVVYTNPPSSGGGPFSFSALNFLDADTVAIETQLEVSLNGVLLTLTTDYTVNTSAETVSFVTATLDAGDRLVLERVTKNDSRYVTFTDASKLNQSDMNLNSDQLFFLVQEALDIANDSISKGTDGLWNGQNIETICFVPATDGTGLVTLAQMESFVNGGEVQGIDAVVINDYTGDNIETEFKMTGIFGALDGQIDVYIDGVWQESEAANYSILSFGDVGYPGLAGVQDDFIVFVIAPANNASIFLKSLTGTVNAILNTDILTLDFDDITYPSGATENMVFIDILGIPTLEQLTASKVSDLVTVVQANTLDVFANPVAAINMNNQRITTLLSGISTSHAVNKGQMDAADSATLATAVAHTDASIGSSEVKNVADMNLSNLSETLTIAATHKYLEIQAKADSIVDTGESDVVTSWVSGRIRLPSNATQQERFISLGFSLPVDGNQRFFEYGMKVEYVSDGVFTLRIAARLGNTSAWSISPGDFLATFSFDNVRAFGSFS